MVPIFNETDLILPMVNTALISLVKLCSCYQNAARKYVLYVKYIECLLLQCELSLLLSGT